MKKIFFACGVICACIVLCIIIAYELKLVSSSTAFWVNSAAQIAGFTFSAIAYFYNREK